MASISLDEIQSKIHLIVLNIISESSYYEYVNIGLLSAESISLQDSVVVELDR